MFFSLMLRTSLLGNFIFAYIFRFYFLRNQSHLKDKETVCEGGDH